jgi:hypothetical protein
MTHHVRLQMTPSSGMMSFMLPFHLYVYAAYEKAQFSDNPHG